MSKKYGNNKSPIENINNFKTNSLHSRLLQNYVSPVNDEVRAGCPKLEHTTKDNPIYDKLIKFDVCSCIKGKIFYYTALCNHMRIVFEEMSCWKALTMYLGMKILDQMYI